MTPLEIELLDALIEMREAMCASMRVIADIDTMHRLKASAEARQQRFVDELHVAGIKDGFGKRTDDLIHRLRPAKKL